MAKKRKKKQVKEFTPGDLVVAAHEVNEYYPGYFRDFKKSLLDKQREYEMKLKHYEDELKAAFFEVVYRNHPELRDYHFNYQNHSGYIVVTGKKDKTNHL